MRRIWRARATTRGWRATSKFSLPTRICFSSNCCSPIRAAQSCARAPSSTARSAAAGSRNEESMAKRLKEKVYLKELRKLQVKLCAAQEWVKEKKLRVVVVLEGRDGAGKGGTIKAITERVSPRVFRVIALPAPSDREKSQMYVQRYIPHFPASGEIAIFDRSWYNRGGVERVMGFCTDEDARDFLKVAPLVEKAMVNSGIILLKYWMEVSPEEQTRRLESRIDDGRKLWKLSPM